MRRTVDTKLRQSGLTLTELAVVIAVMALLAGLALPAARMVIGSFESGDSARSMISAALASARALAAKEGHYVGVRFQMAYDREAADPLDPLVAPQYMVFIVHDSNVMAAGFRGLQGLQPIKLPHSIAVMDLTIVVDRSDSGSYAEIGLAADARIDEPREVRDATSFSVVFSPKGKLLIHRVQVRNREGIPDTESTRTGAFKRTSDDDVFNKKGDVDNWTAELERMEMGREKGMFYQDDYYGVLNTPAYPDVPPRVDLGLGPEYSRNRFVIYDRDKFARAYKAGRAWSDYLAGLAPEAIYINPYMGTIISKD